MTVRSRKSPSGLSPKAGPSKTTPSGHTRFYNPGGEYVTDYPATPGRPQRRMADLQVKLRKEGLQVPPPSKKERRAKRADATDERDNNQQDPEEKDNE